MGVQKSELEFTSSISADKMFKGLCLETDTIIPKAAPGAYKTVEIKGDGGVGTLKHITLPDESPVKTMTLRIDGIDKEALTFDYSIIDGDILLGFIESIVTHLTVSPAAGGGSITKTTTVYNTKGDAVIPEENMKYADAQNNLLFKGIEAYRLPHCKLINLQTTHVFCVSDAALFFVWQTNKVSQLL